MSPWIINTSLTCKSFTNEKKILKSLRHRNLAVFFGFFHSAVFHFLFLRAWNESNFMDYVKKVYLDDEAFEVVPFFARAKNQPDPQ